MQVGRASVAVEGDVSRLARDTETKIDAALASMRIDPVEIESYVDTDRLSRDVNGRLRNAKGEFAKAGEVVGDALGDGAGRSWISRLIGLGREAASSFTKSLGDGLSGLSGAFSSNPYIGAAGAVVGVALAAYAVPALAAAVTSGLAVVLGAGLLGAGVFALLGGKDDRDKALADLQTAREQLKDAEAAAKSGSASSLRRVAEARKVLAEAEKVANGGKAYRELDKALDSLKDTFGEVARQAARPLLKPLTTALGDLDQLVRELRPEFTQIFSALAPVIPLLTDAVGKFSGEVVRGLRDSMPGITAAFEGFANVLPTVGRWIGDFFRILFGNKDLIDNTTEAVTKLVFGPLKLLGPILSGLNVLFGAFANLIKLDVQNLGLIKDVLLEFVDGGSGALGRLSEAWAPLKTAIQEAWDTLKAFAGEDDTTKLGERWQDFLGSVKDIWAPLKEFLSVAWDEAWAAVQRIWDEKVVPWWEETAAPWLKEQISAAISAAWEAAKAKAAEKINQFVEDTANRLQALPGRVLDILLKLPGVVASALSSAAQAAIKGASLLVSGFVNGVTKLPGLVLSALNAVRGAVTGAFASAGSWLISAGARIVGGLIAGIQSQIGRVRDLLGQLTNLIPDWKGPAAKDAMLLHESGRLVMQGFQHGLESQRGAVERTLRDLTGALPGIALPGPVAGGDGAAAGGLSVGEIHVHVSGATGAEAGQEAVVAILEGLAGAVIVR